MYSDIDSLTELSSSDHEEDEFDTRLKKGKTKANGDKKPWKLKQVLKAPRQSTHSVESIYADVTSGKLDLNPDYQREVVWSDSKQSALIDSLLNNYYIPPVIFACHEIEDGEERRTCIDGKQRLTSMQRFMDGMIPFKDPDTNRKFYYKRFPGQNKGEVMPQKYRDQFRRKQIICVEYSDVTGEDEREIFKRVQMGMALTPAERMQAIPGPWSALVREAISLFEQNKTSERLDLADSRGRDFQMMATVIYTLHRPEKAFPGPGTLASFLQSKEKPTSSLQDRVKGILDVLSELVDCPERRTIFSDPAKTSPVEFCCIAEAIGRYMETQTLDQLATGIEEMRKDVRIHHIDIRMNNVCSKTLRSFIRNNWPGKSKKKVVESALAYVKAKRAKDPQKKRKRDKNSDDESVEQEKLKKIASSPTQQKKAPESPIPKRDASDPSSLNLHSKGLNSSASTATPGPYETAASTQGDETASAGGSRLAKLKAAAQRDHSRVNSPASDNALDASLASRSSTPHLSNGVSSTPQVQSQPPNLLQGVDPNVVKNILNRSQPNNSTTVPVHSFFYPLSGPQGGMPPPSAYPNHAQNQMTGSVSDPQMMLQHYQNAGIPMLSSQGSTNANSYASGSISAPPPSSTDDALLKPKIEADDIRQSTSRFSLASKDPNSMSTSFSNPNPVVEKSGSGPNSYPYRPPPLSSGASSQASYSDSRDRTTSGDYRGPGHSPRGGRVPYDGGRGPTWQERERERDFERERGREYEHRRDREPGRDQMRGKVSGWGPNRGRR